MEQNNAMPLETGDGFTQLIAMSENIELKPQTKDIDFSRGYEKLKLTDDEKKHVSALVQQIPSMLATTSLANTYSVVFPDGIQHELVALSQGGVGSMFRDPSTGRFLGHASFYSNAPQAAVLGVFNAMSIASGQYFLSQINKEMKVMKMNLDRILEFLYGEKKAELLAEVNFVKYAYENYKYIMTNAEHRIATIKSLQDSKKIAMKDIEFYISDLDSTVNGKSESDIRNIADKAFQVKDSLELSMQLYGMSSVLEVYYAQNYEQDYIKYIENEIITYLDKCEKRMLSSFSVLDNRIDDFKGNPLKKIDKSAYEKVVSEFVDSLKSGEESIIRKSLKDVLKATNSRTEYYLNNDGTVYLKTASL